MLKLQADVPDLASINEIEGFYKVGPPVSAK